MTGVVSRGGFRFQDLVLVHRVLDELIDVRLAEIGAKATTPPLTYRIEASATCAVGGPDWDLVTLTTTGSPVLEEVKSGPPSAEDRRQLWLRLRRTLSQVARGEAVTLCLTVNAVYTALAKNGGRFVVANCWAHVRRKLIEAEPFFADAKQCIDLIGELYEIEKLCPTGPPGDELRQRLRDERSRDVVRRIHEWALATRALPESALGKAIAYMGGIWSGLVRFLEDPRIPIDNNATERSLRGVVVGRKNHYGSKSRRGTEVAAVFYSLIESAKLAGIEPHAYMREAACAGLQGERVPLPHEMAQA